MPIQTRRQRERKEREQLIVTAARELAEAKGWDAATTRRPAAKDTRGVLAAVGSGAAEGGVR